MKIFSKGTYKREQAGTHCIFRLELQTNLDSVPSFLVLLQGDESLGFAEVALVPLTLEIDNVLSVHKCAEEVTCFQEGDRTVREDGCKFLPHDLIRLPQRPLYGNAGSHGVSLKSHLVLLGFEQGLNMACKYRRRESSAQTPTFPSSLVTLITWESFWEMTVGGGGHRRFGFVANSLVSLFRRVKSKPFSSSASSEFAPERTKLPSGPPSLRFTGLKSASMTA